MTEKLFCVRKKPDVWTKKFKPETEYLWLQASGNNHWGYLPECMDRSRLLLQISRLRGATVKVGYDSVLSFVEAFGWEVIECELNPISQTTGGEFYMANHKDFKQKKRKKK